MLFSDSFVPKTTKQSNSGCNGASLNRFSRKVFKKQSALNTNTVEKYIANKDNCFAYQDDKICFLPNSRYLITPIADIKESLQKLDAFCFNYQHVDCLYIVFNYRFNGKSAVKSGQLFDNVQRAFTFNHQNRRVDRMPSITRMRLLREKYKKHLLSSFQKANSMQTSGSVFAARIEQIERTNLELQLIKIEDCFLDGHSNYTSNFHIIQKRVFVNQAFSDFQTDLYKSIGSAKNKINTTIKNPIDIENAISKSGSQMWDKYMLHTHQEAFYDKPLSISNELFFDVGNISIKFQRES